MKITTKDITLELTIEEWKELSSQKTIEEWKELSSQKDQPVNFTKDSSHKPSIVKPIPISKEVKPVLTDKNPHNKKVTNEQIKQIKYLAEQGLGNPEIAKRLNLYPELINYWRKNTPKGLYD